MFTCIDSPKYIQLLMIGILLIPAWGCRFLPSNPSVHRDSLLFNAEPSNHVLATESPANSALPMDPIEEPSNGFQIHEVSPAKAGIQNNRMDSSLRGKDFFDLAGIKPTSSQPTPRPPADFTKPESNNGLTLETLEALALSQNPTIQKIESEIQALCGKKLQVGLYPNPTSGVFGDDINDNGGSGRYGVFYNQRVVRSNRLCLARNTVDAEITAKEIELAEFQQRLQTDIRLRFYDLLVANAKTEVANQLYQVSENGVKATRQLVDAKEVATTSLTQAELEFEKARLNVQRVGNEKNAAIRKLQWLVGLDDLDWDTVSGDLNQFEEMDGIEVKFEKLLADSPEMSRMYAEVDVAKQNLRHQCSLRIPDVTWQAGVAYDFASDAVVPNFQIGIPIQKYNCNQGAIAQAKNEIAASTFAAERKSLELLQRLVETYRIYQDAKIQVLGIRERLLPRAKKNLDLLSLGYEQGEVGFLDILTAQRSYIQFNLEYVQQLQILWQQKVLIEGLLLDGSLNDD